MIKLALLFVYLSLGIGTKISKNRNLVYNKPFYIVHLELDYDKSYSYELKIFLTNLI